MHHGTLHLCGFEDWLGVDFCRKSGVPVPSKGPVEERFALFHAAALAAFQPVKSGDLVLGLGQDNPVRSQGVRLETQFPGRFSIGGGQALSLGPNGGLDPQVRQHFSEQISGGTLPGFIVSEGGSWEADS